MTIKKLADLLQECADMFGDEADIDVVRKEEIKKTIDEHHQDITDELMEVMTNEHKIHR